MISTPVILLKQYLYCIFIENSYIITISQYIYTYESTKMFLDQIPDLFQKVSWSDKASSCIMLSVLTNKLKCDKAVLGYTDK